MFRFTPDDPLYGGNKLLGFKVLVFNELQIETFLMVYVKQTKYDNASRVVVIFTFLLWMCLLSLIFLLQLVLWLKLSSKILPTLHEFMLSTTVQLRTGLPKMWITAVYEALNNLLLLAIGLKIYF